MDFTSGPAYFEFLSDFDWFDCVLIWIPHLPAPHFIPASSSLLSSNAVS